MTCKQLTEAKKSQAQGKAFVRLFARQTHPTHAGILSPPAHAGNVGWMWAGGAVFSWIWIYRVVWLWIELCFTSPLHIPTMPARK